MWEAAAEAAASEKAMALEQCLAREFRFGVWGVGSGAKGLRPWSRFRA